MRIYYFYIKPQIKWWGHLNKLENKEIVKKFTDGNPTGLRIKRRAKNRWTDEVVNDLRK